MVACVFGTSASMNSQLPQLVSELLWELTALTRALLFVWLQFRDWKLSRSSKFSCFFVDSFPFSDLVWEGKKEGKKIELLTWLLFIPKALCLYPWARCKTTRQGQTTCSHVPLSSTWCIWWPIFSNWKHKMSIRVPCLYSSLNFTSCFTIEIEKHFVIVERFRTLVHWNNKNNY